MLTGRPQPASRTARRSAPRPAHAVVFLAACTAASPACRERPRSHPDDASPRRAAPEDGGVAVGPDGVKILYPAAPDSFVALARKLRPSVVHLRSTSEVTGGPGDLRPNQEASYGLGSGFVLDTGGTIVTNDHVIANAAEVVAVFAGGEQLPARIIGRDAQLDIALLEVQASPRFLQPARLGSSDRLETGEWVVALGNPFGEEVTASAGIVSATGVTSSERIVAQKKKTNYAGFLRTDVVIDAGNSGGPLINMAGEVVGISSAIETRAGPIGYAVPIDRARHFFPQLKKEGVVSRAWLGVFVHPVTPGTAKSLNMEVVSGALVSDVVPGGPGSRAGIRPGDVILRFDGKEVDHRNLPWLASTSGIGRQIDIALWRSGAERTVQLISEKMPE